jgi:phage-related protein
MLLDVMWSKRTRSQVKSFPKEVRDELGYLIYRLQNGDWLKMPISRPMPSILVGCYELRVRGRDGIFRIFYYLKLENKIVIFHAFQKKTETTPTKEIELGRKNLKEILDEKK